MRRPVRRPVCRSRYDDDLRMLRLLRLLKMEQHLPSLTLISDAVNSKYQALQLAMTDLIMFWFLFTAALQLAEARCSLTRRPRGFAFECALCRLAPHSPSRNT